MESPGTRVTGAGPVTCSGQHDHEGSTVLSRIALGVLAATITVALGGCSSSSSSSPAGSAPDASTAAANPSPAPGSGGPWLGKDMATSVLPTKEQVSAAVGTTITKDPSVSSFTAKELVLSAQVDPAACADAYALTWAFTTPKDTLEMTSASYSVGNSSVVIDIADSPMSLQRAKDTIAACPTFTVVKTHGASTYAVGDSISRFTVTRNNLASPESLEVSLTSDAQILMSIDEACTGTASPGLGCVERRTDQVNQVVRRVGPNLLSVWGVATSAVDGAPAPDPPISPQAILTLADQLQQSVTAQAR